MKVKDTVRLKIGDSQETAVIVEVIGKVFTTYRPAPIAFKLDRPLNKMTIVCNTQLEKVKNG